MTLITVSGRYPAPVRVRGAIVVLILVGLTSSCSSRAGPESGNAETAPAHSAAPAPDADSFGQFRRDWPRTDFSRSQVKAFEIIRGCPGRDCIPALDAAGTTNIPGLRTGQAKFTDSGNTKYAPQLPVAVVTVGDITRAYPLHILTWHEVINDRFWRHPRGRDLLPALQHRPGF